VAIEHKYFQWLKDERSGKNNEKKAGPNSRIMVGPEWFIDFPSMKQVNIFHVDQQRPVKRGDKNERSIRPSDEKFMDNTNFLVGKFKATTEDSSEGSGFWLGIQFHDTIDRKLFPV